MVWCVNYKIAFFEEIAPYTRVQSTFAGVLLYDVELQLKLQAQEWIHANSTWARDFRGNLMNIHEITYT